MIYYFLVLIMLSHDAALIAYRCKVAGIIAALSLESRDGSWPSYYITYYHIKLILYVDLY